MQKKNYERASLCHPPMKAIQTNYTKKLFRHNTDEMSGKCLYIMSQIIYFSIHV